MNSANEILRAIKNKKSLLKRKYEQSPTYSKKQYEEDIALLDKEEKEWLEQFDDIPINEIYKE